MNDPFVREARARGYRSRAAFKIVEINESYRIFREGQRVMDLGSAPGGWSQLVVASVGRGNVFAVDLVAMEPIDGVEFTEGDFLDANFRAALAARLGTEKFDVIMSDMAPNGSGDPKTDHLRIVGLVEQAIDFALEFLKVGGTLVAKIFQGGEERRLVAELRKYFERVSYCKPKSSRKDSAEMYLVAQRLVPSCPSASLSL